MPRRAFLKYFPLVANCMVRWLAAGLACAARLEAHIAKRNVIMSDVFGADVFFARAATPLNPPSQKPASDACARWDAALDFESPPTAMLHDAESVLPPPLFLCRSKPEQADDAARVTQPAFRIRWRMIAIAACLLVVWIGAGQSDPLAPSTPPQIRNLAADALADTFSGGPSRTMAAAEVSAVYDDARLHFAPRLARFYASNVSTTGSVSAQPINAETSDSAPPDDEASGMNPNDAALSLSRETALVMIRNLPEGARLSAGTRVSPTDWALSSGDLKSIVVTLPDNRNAPVRAMIEVFAMSGAPAGAMSVEIREQESGLQQASTPRRAKVYRTAAGKPASQKRRTKPLAASQQTGNANAAPTSPATQQIQVQLPFLPGPHSAKPPPGTTVGQQILINLGVPLSPPVAVGFAQNN